MQFLLPLMMTPAEQYLPLARAAEEHGFDGIALADSLCYPEHSDTRYPHTPDGDRSFLDGKPFVEPMVAMAAMAAVTSRLRFYTTVLKLPVRQPVVLAKQLTSLAAITGGRVALGVGLSPWPEDFAATGVPWAGRGKRMDEMMDALRGLMGGGYFGFDGEHVSFPPVKLNPVPERPVPLLVGGHSPAAFERAARRGDGWISVGSKPAELAEAVAEIEARRARCGRAQEPFSYVVAGRATAEVDGVRALQAVGATHVIADFGSRRAYDRDKHQVTLAENRADLAGYASRVLGAFR